MGNDDVLRFLDEEIEFWKSDRSPAAAIHLEQFTDIRLAFLDGDARPAIRIFKSIVTDDETSAQTSTQTTSRRQLLSEIKRVNGLLRALGHNPGNDRGEEEA